MTTGSLVQPRPQSRPRSKFVANLWCYSLTLLYTLGIAYAYEVLSRWWDYFGFTYNLEADYVVAASCIIAAAPSLLLEKRPQTFAQGAAWFMYLLVFVPSMIVPVMQYSFDPWEVGKLFAMVVASCVIFILISRRKVSHISLERINPILFWAVFGFIWALLVGFIVYDFGSNLNFVGVDEIYDQRFAIGDLIADKPLVRYSIALLSSALDPFLIAYGLYSRRYWICGIGILGQVILFGTLAARATLLSPLFVIAIWFLADKEMRMRSSRLLLGMVAMIILTIPLLLVYNPVGGGANQLVSLIYMRTLLISGSMFGVYVQFFSINELTFFSNNNFISWFVDYPYRDDSLGQAVMRFLSPQEGFYVAEANANFLATDGIAALGPYGVPVASVLAALALLAMSKFVQRERSMLMTSASAGFLLSLANTSLLTSLITGGGILIALLIIFAPDSPPRRPRSRNPHM